MKLIIFAMLIALVTVSCSTVSNTISKMTSSVEPIQLKKYEVKTLKNGLKVYFIPDPSLPRVSLTMLVRVGLRNETIPGQNFMTSELLESGTQKKSAIQVADELGSLGTALNVSGGADFTVMSLDSLSTQSEKMLSLFSEILQKPAFKDQEIERLRSQALAQLATKKDNPSVVAEDYYEQLVFSGHPYARDTMGTPESIRAVKKKDIIQHYLAWYRPNNSSLAVVGAYDEKFVNHVVEQLENWGSRKLNTIDLKENPAITGSEVQLLIKPGLAQTQIRIGDRGVARNNPDYLKLRLAAEILGGSFASRLMQKVRDDLGLTYSIGSSIDARLEPGAITISTFTKNETAKRTIVETKNVLQDFLKTGPTDRELKAAKNQLIGQFPRAIETADRYAFNILALDCYGVPLTYLTDFNQNVDRISLDEINQVLKKYFHPDNLKILVYGDSSIEAQMAELNPKVIRL